MLPAKYRMYSILLNVIKALDAVICPDLWQVHFRENTDYLAIFWRRETGVITGSRIDAVQLEKAERNRWCSK